MLTWPAKYVFNSADCALSMIEPGSAMLTVYVRPDRKSHGYSMLVNNLPFRIELESSLWLSSSSLSSLFTGEGDTLSNKFINFELRLAYWITRFLFLLFLGLENLAFLVAPCEDVCVETSISNACLFVCQQRN